MQDFDPLSRGNSGPSRSLAERAWAQIANSKLGFTLQEPRRILLFTDWGGEHADAIYKTISLFFVDGDSLNAWLTHVEGNHLQSRVVAYKRLNDAIKRQELLPFLRSTDRLHGLLLTVAFHRNTPSQFQPPSDPEVRREYDADKSLFSANDFQKVLTTIDLAGYFTALLVPEHASFTWVSDEDSILEGDARKQVIARAFRSMVRMSSDSPVRKIALTINKRGESDRNAEIAAAIADLSAGAASDLFSQLLPDGIENAPPIWQSLPTFRDLKIDYLVDWIHSKSTNFTRIIFGCSRAANGGVTSALMLGEDPIDKGILLPLTYHIDRLRRREKS